MCGTGDSKRLYGPLRDLEEMLALLYKKTKSRAWESDQ